MALDVADPAALAAAVVFAESAGCLDDLRDTLRWLDTFEGGAHCVMSAAPPPYTFDFAIFERHDASWRPVFVGRLAYTAPRVRNGCTVPPTFSVSITSTRSPGASSPASS